MIVRATEENIRRAAEIIKKGGLVAFPTETVYGLGASAFNPKAVARIFEVKRRPMTDPVIVHICEFKELEKLCSKIDERVKKLAKAFWPGPLTVVLPKSKNVPDIVTAGLDTVAVRMPSHWVARKLIKLAGPIAAPSANMFSKVSPTRAEHVEEQLGDKIDLILDGGKCEVGVESTIIDLSEERPVILRPGGVSVEDIRRVIGDVDVKTVSERPKAPGQMKKHYSPNTPLKIVYGEIKPPKGLKAGLLAFKDPKPGFAKVEVLSPSGDLREAAANLYDALHRLDKAGLDVIVVEAVPEKGLGRAIMDRLRKAQGFG